MSKAKAELYFVTDSTGFTQDDFLEVVQQACDGGVTLVQLREKDKTGLEYFRLAEEVKCITDKYGIPLIIDDRVDIALAVDADGVHVGQSDIPVYVARQLLGESKIIGATAKTVEQAILAESEGADYLGVGAIFPTTTKVVTHITEVSTLNAIVEATSIPAYAIGGLNATNMHVLYESKASGMAVVSAIMKSSDPRATARKLRQLVEANFKVCKS
ncbi:MAG: thiamine phosphate synthase [Oscillospiraceae bacterium]|nr:thiamine phosphate synthase [Oscillospiraceae bacterium]